VLLTHHFVKTKRAVLAGRNNVTLHQAGKIERLA
jgi:hypothetical protein